MVSGRTGGVAALLTAVTVSLGSAVATGGTAQAAPGEATAAAPAADRLLDRPERGAAALDRIAERLPEAAARNGMSARALAALVRGDADVWLDVSGRAFYIDSAHIQGGHVESGHADGPRAEHGRATLAAESTGGEAPYPADQTFALHSKPGAARVIHLDFDGGVVSGTAWNTNYPGIGTSAQPAFDTDGDPTSFSEAERAVVQSVWERVSEDYAPFDVDVTTQDPGLEAIRRSTTSDSQYGTRVLITPSLAAQGAICSAGCGGVAYVGVFDIVEPHHSDYQPAWVFPHMLGNTAKNIAEAASHEAGHNLGLRHDGTATVGYYEGHGAWAPIMGVGYSKPVAQWSAGEYTGADNREDDLAVMQANGLPVRADDHGGTPATATRPGPGPSVTQAGVISARGDADVFAVAVCSGSVTAEVTPAPTAANLDARLRLLTAAGTVVAVADPQSAYVDRDTATHLGAALTATVADGTYYLEVDGVGALDPATTGYSDYGSLGAYTLTSTACGAVAATVPTAPVIGTASAGANGGAVTATARWSAPASDGGSPITAYVVTAQQLSSKGAVVDTVVSAPQDATSRSLVMTLPVKASYRFLVTAENGVGPGPASEPSGKVAAR